MYFQLNYLHIINMQFYDYTIYIDYGTFNFGICESKDINELFHDNPDFYRIKRIISQSEDKERILNAHKTFGKLSERAQKYYYDIEKRIAFIPYPKDLENATSKFMRCSERMPLIKFSINGIAGVTIRYFSKVLFINMDRLFSITGLPLMLDEQFRCKCHAINDSEYNSWKNRIYYFIIQNMSTETLKFPSGNVLTINYEKELDIFFYEFEKIITNLQDIEIEDVSIMSPSKYFNIE